jgi:Tfp pilus assembly protein PilE
MKKTIIIIFLLFAISIQAYGMRIQKPRHFTYPMNEADVKELNSIFEQLFLMQQGRFELDKVTTTKSSANTGEIWIRQNGGLNYLEVMVDGTIYSISL